ncbi:MAG: hypothetical protein IPP83_05925 [Flavobacteriales bacterium]|nr:hypothetical protein [Flavobacteriales bacterium]
MITNELTLRTTSTGCAGTAAGHGLRYGTLKLFATNGFPMNARITMERWWMRTAPVLATIPVQGQVARDRRSEWSSECFGEQHTRRGVG